MGKKKIANKFASVKRIISSKDHRMYLPSYEANKTRQRSKSTIASANRPWPSKPPTMLKSNNCTHIDNPDQKNLRVCFSRIITHLDHRIGSSSIPTSSTSPSKINLTSSKQAWTVYWVNASRISLIAWWVSLRSLEWSIGWHWRYRKIQDSRGWSVIIRERMLMIALWRGSNSIVALLLPLAIRISRGGLGRCQECPLCISCRISIPSNAWLKPTEHQNDTHIHYSSHNLQTFKNVLLNPLDKCLDDLWD